MERLVALFMSITNSCCSTCARLTWSVITYRLVQECYIVALIDPFSHGLWFFLYDHLRPSSIWVDTSLVYWWCCVHVACLAHVSFIRDCKSLQSGVFLYNIRANCGFLPVSFSLENKFFTRRTYFSSNPLDWWQ